MLNQQKGGSNVALKKKKKVGTETRMPAFKSSPSTTSCDFG